MMHQEFTFFNLSKIWHVVKANWEMALSLSWEIKTHTHQKSEADRIYIFISENELRNENRE